MKKPRERFLSKYDGKKYGWFLLAKEFVITLLVLTILFSVFLGVSKVEGQSMEPTLSQDDVVFFTRFNRSYKRGDVILAQMPTGELYVKRIVALEGDVITLSDGCLYINGVPEQDWGVLGPTNEEEGIVSYPYTVEPDKYFLLGDNRPQSIDSRAFGALPESSIRGKILFH